MLWLVPHLFADPRLIEVAAAGLRLPGLQTLLARAALTQETPTGTEGALCAALGIVRQQDWPLAPITLEADGGIAGTGYWLRADPAHFHIMRDRIVLGASPTDLTRVESDALADAISHHFDDTFTIRALHPQRWYVHTPLPPRLVTTPPSIASGCAIDGILPQGEDASIWRARLNELQMLLHTHPVNLAREARGALPINSLWLWGGGRQPVIAKGLMPVYAGDDVIRIVARHCGAPLHDVPEKLEADALCESGLLVLDTLAAPAGLGDALGWREALRTLDANWFGPLAGNLRKQRAEGLRILDPISGRGVRLHRSDAWKFWRQPRDLASGLGS